MAAPSSDKEKLPKGVGRVPQWWMDITPHDTLVLEEDKERRQLESDEAAMFARKAAEYDMMQKWGGEGYPNWEPSVDGPRTLEEKTEWTTKGYQQTPDNKWVDEKGEPLEGRQFKGTVPPGYIAGQYGPGGTYDPAKFSGSALKSTAGYAQDENKGWSKPDWMKVKLKSTGKGSAIRGGDPYNSPNKKINKTTGGTATVGSGAKPADDDAEEAVAPDEIVLDDTAEDGVFEDDDESEAAEEKEFTDIGSAATPKNAMSPELQKIMARRAQTSGE